MYKRSFRKNFVNDVVSALTHYDIELILAGFPSRILEQRIIEVNVKGARIRRLVEWGYSKEAFWQHFCKTLRLMISSMHSTDLACIQLLMLTISPYGLINWKHFDRDWSIIKPINKSNINNFDYHNCLALLSVSWVKVNYLGVISVINGMPNWSKYIQTNSENLHGILAVCENCFVALSKYAYSWRLSFNEQVVAEDEVIHV